MERHSLAFLEEDRPLAGFDVGVFLQPAFLAQLNATGRIVSFRANLVHARRFGTSCETERREWLDAMGRTLVTAREIVEREERRRSRWWRLSLVPLGPVEGSVRGILGLCTDVTDAKAARLHLESAAFEDGLTGLFNRRRFDRDLADAIATARTGTRSFALLLGDMDRFKPINDTHGHAAGDDILRCVAATLREGLRGDDRLYRIGGDEFAAILATGQKETAAAIGLRLKARIRGLSSPDGEPLSISIGSAVYEPGMDGRELLASADAAMYADKRKPSASIVR